MLVRRSYRQMTREGTEPPTRDFQSSVLSHISRYLTSTYAIANPLNLSWCYSVNTVSSET
jgi:hypothetical protein